jgi:dolichyl-phosphate beta-glucosyltransferase
MSYDKYQTWKTTLQDYADISIVIPAYNESERILPTLGAMAVVVSSLGYSWEVIVSDDGSSDNTVQLAEELGWKNLRVIRHTNTGKGGAVKRGVLASRGRYVLFADADNSTPIEELSHMLAKLDEGYDIAIGSRAAAGAKVENKSALRHLVSWSLRKVAAYFSGIKVSDTQCGFKLFTREAAHALFTRQKMLGFSFDLELIYLATKFGYRIAEVPVHWFDAPGSKVDSVRDSVRFFRDIFAVKQLDRRGAYESRF